MATDEQVEAMMALFDALGPAEQELALLVAWRQALRWWALSMPTVAEMTSDMTSSGRAASSER